MGTNKSMTEAIFSFNFDCGRQGSLSGKFISTQEKVDKLIESKVQVYFGEVLGKHSEIFGCIDKEEIILVSDDPETVKMFKENKFASGYDPFEYGFITPADQNSEDWEDALVEEYIEYLINK